MKKNIGKLKWVGSAIFLGIIVSTTVCEICYRYQFFDFYAKEFKLLNSLVPDSRENIRVLLLGDSFTADENGYTKTIRNMLPGYSVFNGGVPGFCPIQESMILGNLLLKVKPHIVMLQLYEGNDLSDYKTRTKPDSNFDLKITVRSVMKKIRFLGWLNYKLRGLSPSVKIDPSKQNDSIFNSTKYNTRDGEFFQKDSLWAEDQICLNGERKKDFSDLLGIVQEIRTICEIQGIEFRVVNIPYCARVSPVHLKNLQKIGAVFPVDGCCKNEQSNFSQSLGASFGDKFYDPAFVLSEKCKAGLSPYYLHDPHLNSLGAETVGQFLSEKIISINIKP